jgi:hypothetical protein
MNETPSFLSAALKAIAKGTPVFPCGEQKKTPLTAHGFQDATADEATVRQWAAKWPTANLAIPTGERSGLIVLDVDKDEGKDGEAALSELTSKNGVLPVTLEVKTPRGGRHLYFRHPGQKVPTRTNHPAPALDVRGDGGYVLIPPSATKRGAYTWANRTAPAECPPWLLALLLNGSAPADKPHAVTPSPAPASSGDPTEEESRIREAIRFIPAGDYDTWTKIGMALHGWDPQRGFGLWDEWSRTCPEKYDERQPPKKWASFKADRPGGVTLGTLFEYAKRGGWTPPPAARVFLGGAGAKACTTSEPVEIEEPTAYEPFPVDALPEPHRALVIHGAESIGCEQALIALPLLAATAGAIGNARRIMLKRGWVEPAVLWAVTVAASGDKKSPGFELGIDGLAQIEERAFAQYRAELDEHKQAVQRWKEAGAEGQKPEPPTATRFIVRDITVEGLAAILAENWRGVMLARDELSAWVGGFDKYHGGGKGEESAHWLEMYRAGKVTVDRKTGDTKTIHVPRAAVSITGTIQPGTLERVLERRHFENGLAARLLLACPPRQLRQWNEDEVDERLLIPVRRVFERLAGLPMGADGFGNPVPIDLPMTPEGKARWITFYNEHAAEMHGLGDDRLCAAWSKLEGATARFALLVHCVRAAAQDDTLRDAAAVDVDSIEAAIRLVTWFKGETRRIYGRLAESEDTRDTRKVLECVQAKGGRVTVRDVGRAGVCGGDTARIAAILDQLAEAGEGTWITVPPTERGGRPTRTFELHRRNRETNRTPSEPSESTRETDRTDKTPPAKGGFVSFAVSSEGGEPSAEVSSVSRFRQLTPETKTEEGTL